MQASELLPDERNWRRHPAGQVKAVRSVFRKIGIADAVIARETPEGLRLVDGHLRSDIDPDQVLPVLVVDLDEDESGIVLASLDPLAAMAERDNDALASLLQSLGREDEETASLLRSMHDDVPGLEPEPTGLSLIHI